MHFGCNTNGIAHHDLPHAVDLLVDISYASVAITIDHSALSQRLHYGRSSPDLQGVILSL
jgi:hypothetical protein